jgi:hypothetical protein
MSYEFACEFLRETDKAILVKEPVSEEEIWIPLSQVDEIHRDKGGRTGSLVVTDWIASQKGLT